MLGLLRRMLNANEREVRRLQAAVAVINGLEPQMTALDDDGLRAKTVEFRERLRQGATLDDLLPEAFAVAREGARRAVGMRPFDVQLMGGMVLHEGRIAEMRTGEGKTLVETLPAYLNALTGRGVHIVTVNDYLARRDSQWMGQIYRFLGLSVGLIVHDFDSDTRRRNYGCDIVYGNHNEFGFDYLRDNMAMSLEEVSQRELHYAIVDEVDSILIDEARTPLIISGAVEKPTEPYYRFAAVVDDLELDRDYTVDEKMQTVVPTEAGVRRVEQALGVQNLFDVENMSMSHYLENALKAKTLFARDQKYIVQDGEVVLVDEFTGRLMFGRRYGHGLHEAIEAKEGCKIPQGTQTQATITFQNYFRLYEKLAGMTGTALTEEDEFHKIYKLDVVAIPTNLPMIRKDLPDVVYKTDAAKLRAVVAEIKECHDRQQPVLVGTIDIDKNERLGKLLDRAGIPYQLLNAKQHDKEAQIIAQAGRAGAVTIATNMAGRGTDILLGGNPEYLARQRLLQENVPLEDIDAAAEQVPDASLQGEDAERIARLRSRYRDLVAAFKRETDAEHERVTAAGGLHVLGTERHESRRIDNQLRGRSGRQGDPGTSRFFLSLEDSLMRLFGAEYIRGIMDRLGVEEDEPIESGMVTRAIERAQRKVEARNFEARKHVLDYDDVMNQQREVIYRQRRQLLENEDCHPYVRQMLEDVLQGIVDSHCPERTDPEDWDLGALLRAAEQFFLPVDQLQAQALVGLDAPAIRERLLAEAAAVEAEREAMLGPEGLRQLERNILLWVVNEQWIEQLEAMDELREGITLRAYGQLDPLTQFKIEAHEMFQEMVQHIREESVRLIYRVNLQPIELTPEQQAELEQNGTLEVQWAGDEAELTAEGEPEARLQAPPAGVGRAALAGAADAGVSLPPEPAVHARPPLAAVPDVPSGRRLPLAGSAPARARSGGRKARRNEPCPCGSGKKYKHCCGR